MRGLRLLARSVQREKPLGCLRAKSGLRLSEQGLNSTIVKIVAGFLMTISVADASANQRLEFLDEVLPQRPGMKTEEDYQRFVQEHGLPQRSEPTPEDLDRLRSQSRKELKLEEEYSRRNSSSISEMSDDEI